MNECHMQTHSADASRQYDPICSGVARICCGEGQSWKLGHGALTANFKNFEAGWLQQLLDDY